MTVTSNFVKAEQMQIQEQDRHLNGAAIIDSEGREIPITEQMISAALRDLEMGYPSQEAPQASRPQLM